MSVANLKILFFCLKVIMFYGPISYLIYKGDWVLALMLFSMFWSNNMFMDKRRMF